ncbi:MAG: DUF2851 family protein, partial [Crocinitomicaceae bacterium]|nr:DUF2851 family protein [Crocinitomicaceae bacterium]
MKEDFLHYIWRFRLFTTAELKTVQGEKIIIHHPGIYNTDGGPDFLNARITIGNTRWVGHIEIHVRAGDWHRHRHTHDPHYKNVILHAVFENDASIYLNQPGDLAVLDLSAYYEPAVLDRYESWMSNRQWIPCASSIGNIDSVVLISWKDRLVTERLESRTLGIIKRLEKNEGSWPETFYQLLARNFGFKTNSDAFEMLAESLPMKILSRHSGDPFQVEALFFGQAGLLNGRFVHDYPGTLQKEYSFLSKKYGLTPLNPAIWNFARMRPANFPPRRLSQLSALLCKPEHLFSTVLETDDMEALVRLLCAAASDFWTKNYRFVYANETEKIQLSLYPATEKILVSPKPGTASVENIVINTIVPVLVAYGKLRDEERYIEKALRLLEKCAAEENAIVKKWKRLGIEATTALDSQALLQLYHSYCGAKKCLECRIGLYL